MIRYYCVVTFREGSFRSSEDAFDLGEEARNIEATSTRMRRELEQAGMLRQQALSLPGSTPSIPTFYSGNSVSASLTPRRSASPPARYTRSTTVRLSERVDNIIMRVVSLFSDENELCTY